MNIANTSTTSSSAVNTRVPLLVVSWLWVSVPLAWGVVATVMKSMALFRG